MYMYFIIFKNPPPLSASSSWWATLKTWTSLLWLQMCEAPPLALAWPLRPTVDSHYMVQMTQFWSASVSGSANQNSDKNDKVRGGKNKGIEFRQWQIETAALIYVWMKRRWMCCRCQIFPGTVSHTMPAADTVALIRAHFLLLRLKKRCLLSSRSYFLNPCG